MFARRKGGCPPELHPAAIPSRSEAASGACLAASARQWKAQGPATAWTRPCIERSAMRPLIVPEGGPGGTAYRLAYESLCIGVCGFEYTID